MIIYSPFFPHPVVRLFQKFQSNNGNQSRGRTSGDLSWRVFSPKSKTRSGVYDSFLSNKLRGIFCLADCLIDWMWPLWKDLFSYCHSAISYMMVYVRMYFCFWTHPKHFSFSLSFSLFQSIYLSAQLRSISFKRLLQPSFYLTRIYFLLKL